MERLTKDKRTMCIVEDNQKKNYFNQIHDKLSKLEDIEQELGIPLEVLFKALKDGIWSTIKLNRLHKENQIFQFEHVSLKLFEEGWGLVDLRQSFDETLTGTLVLLKDYGKTWGLTKEEIKNEEEI